MKALHFKEHGNIDNLIYGDVPAPEVGDDDVLVRVKACALNHLDLWVLHGWPSLRLPLPHIGGADIAGVVADTGKNVRGWAEGDRAVINPGYLSPGPEDEWTEHGEDSLSPRYHILGEGRWGGFAEYVSVPATALRRIEDSLDFVTACAPLLVGLTSWRMLKIRAQIEAGQSVLIVGAGGGVNSFSIRLARALGATVYALTSSEEKAERARALGADAVCNYVATPDWHKWVLEQTYGLGVHLVVDNVGQATMEKSLRAARRGGKIVTVGNTSGHQVNYDNRYVFTKQLSILGSTMGSTKDFNDMLSFLWDKNIAPIVDSTLPLADGAQGYKKLEEGSQFGKVVLEV